MLCTTPSQPEAFPRSCRHAHPPSFVFINHTYKRLMKRTIFHFPCVCHAAVTYISWNNVYNHSKNRLAKLYGKAVFSMHLKKLCSSSVPVTGWLLHKIDEHFCVVHLCLFSNFNELETRHRSWRNWRTYYWSVNNMPNYKHLIFFLVRLKLQYATDACCTYWVILH